jgi:hypothetical protein
MNTKDWQALNERVKAAQDTDRRRGDLQATSELIDEFAVKTIDGVTIRCGMRVVDYDLRWTTVTGISSVEINGTIWFKTKRGGMMDGQRLWARMP